MFKGGEAISSCSSIGIVSCKFVFRSLTLEFEANGLCAAADFFAGISINEGFSDSWSPSPTVVSLLNSLFLRVPEAEA